MKERNFIIKKLDSDLTNESRVKELWEVAETAYPEGSPWTLEQFQGIVSFDYLILFVAENLAGETIALLIASKTMVEVDIYMLAVKSSHQRRGIARKLFKELIKEARMKELRNVFLEVRVSNLAAYNLYKSLGFQEIGRRKNYYSKPKEDALMMKMNL